LSIIVVSWNVSDFLKDCLQSLVDTGVSEWAQAIVVDNDSFDDTSEMVAANFPWVQLIQSGSNLGFSRGNNLGIGHATGDFVLLLNPDTVVHAHAVDRMLDYAVTHPGMGAVGPKQIDREGKTCYEAAVNFPTVWNVGCDYFKLAKLFPHSRLFNRRLMGYWNHEDDREVQGVPGSAMLLRREAISQVGLLEETMHYGEDMDLCLRLRRAGWKVYYLASACIVHYGGESSRRARNPALRYQIAFQSFWYYLYKNFGSFAAFRLSCMMCVWSLCTTFAAMAMRSLARRSDAIEKLDHMKKVGIGMLRWSTCRKHMFRHHLAKPIALARRPENG
jgi:GT2 family glycosyltransferase